MRSCTERKRYLSGAEVVFECELVALEDPLGILKYVLDRRWQVHGLTLPPGTLTYAFYWTDRPYNLYWWMDGDGRTVGYYFNLADSVELSAREFLWRDLVIDVLVRPGGGMQLIDEEELPDALEGELQAYIQAGKRLLLRDYRAIIEEVAALLERYTAIF
jgi:predicted RNA-binding protein associated with RNAse of E/G family